MPAAQYESKKSVALGDAVIDILYYPDGRYRFAIKGPRLGVARMETSAKGTNLMLGPMPEPPGAP